MTKMTCSCENRIATITLDDGKMNVMNWEFFTELNESLERAVSDGAGAIIFTSRPGIFSAGLDLKLLPTQSVTEQLRFQREFAKTMLKLYLFPIPTIAAYVGHSVAGGAILSYACDRLVMGDGPYVLQINEVANKMLLPSWITLICRSSIPQGYWKEALLHSRAYSPREALDRGIVDQLVPEGEDVLEAARAVATDFLKLDGSAYGSSKACLRKEEADQAMNAFYRELVDWILLKDQEQD